MNFTVFKEGCTQPKIVNTWSFFPWRKSLASFPSDGVMELSLRAGGQREIGHLSHCHVLIFYIDICAPPSS